MSSLINLQAPGDVVLPIYGNPSDGFVYEAFYVPDGVTVLGQAPGAGYSGQRVRIAKPGRYLIGYHVKNYRENARQPPGLERWFQIAVGTGKSDEAGYANMPEDSVVDRLLARAISQYREINLADGKSYTIVADDVKEQDLPSKDDEIVRAYKGKRAWVYRFMRGVEVPVDVVAHEANGQALRGLGGQPYGAGAPTYPVP